MGKHTTNGALAGAPRTFAGDGSGRREDENAVSSGEEGVVVGGDDDELPAVPAEFLSVERFSFREKNKFHREVISTEQQ